MRNAFMAAMAALAAGACAAADAGEFESKATAAIATASLEKRKVPAVAVAIIREGRVAFSGVWGEQSPGVPATRKTAFNVASLTKPVTAETILRLADGGALGLDEPMAGAYADPDVANDPYTKKLTPRLALSHQTGFPNWRDGRLAYKFEPGTAYGYSGEGYDYVARFAEKKTGKAFPVLMRDKVFGPLKMKSAALVETAAARKRIAHPKNAEGAWIEPVLASDWSAADNLVVTIDDYARFVAAVARGEGLSPTLTEERRRIQIKQDLCGGSPAPGCPNPAGFSLGWQRLEFGGRIFFFHSGEDKDTRTIAYFEPATGDGAVGMASSPVGMGAVIDVLATLDPENPIVKAFQAAE